MDETGVWDLVTRFGGWVVGVLGIAITAFLPKKGSLENQRIDQFQEDLDSLRKLQSSDAERIGKLETYVVWYQRRDVAWELYVARLMIGVERGEMPPWPDRDGILAEKGPS